MGFKDELACFSKKVKDFQTVKNNEYIEDTDALAALIVLNFIKYEKVPDIFLAVASLNMLNRYVKQPNTKIGYQFRVHLINVLKGIEELNQKKSILVGYIPKRNNLLIIQFWDFQFSFQAEKVTGQILNILSNKQIEWDGIKKQPCSKSVFEFALASDWISNKTMMNEDLRELIKNEQEGFMRGEYKTINGQFVKVKNVKHRLREGTDHQINYMREKLLECQERPVILIGKFAKVWDKHVTFTMVSPYIKQLITMPVCDHVNLYRPDVEKIVDVNNLVKYERYYIIGYCRKYLRNDRMGVNLAMDLGFSPLMRIQEFKRIPKYMFQKCHRFSIEEYIGFCQKEIFL
ncbi:MAG: hypothetical protein IJ300_13110 [Clostridia bacterium]|nr:hypothetical protein [Clostridia bacterium]